MQIEGHEVRACDANIAHVPRMIFQCRDNEIVVACLCTVSAALIRLLDRSALVFLLESGLVSSYTRRMQSASG